MNNFASNILGELPSISLVYPSSLTHKETKIDYGEKTLRMKGEYKTDNLQDSKFIYDKIGGINFWLQENVHIRFQKQNFSTV